MEEEIKRCLEMKREIEGERLCEVENIEKREREEGGLFSREIIPCDFQILFANKSKVDFMLQLIDVCMSLS